MMYVLKNSTNAWIRYMESTKGKLTKSEKLGQGKAGSKAPKIALCILYGGPLERLF